MSQSHISPKHLYIAASEYIESIISELDKILTDPGFPDQVIILTKSFKRLALTGLNELDKYLKQYNKIESIIDINDALDDRFKQELIESEKQTALAQLILIFQYFKYLSGLIRYIVSSSIETAPLGLIFPFQSILTSLFPKAYIFIRRQWKHNYKYGEFVKQITEQDEAPEYFDKIRDDLNFRLCMVAYPSLEDDNYLYNCNIAHEVGHYINDLSREYGADKEFLKTYEKAVDDTDEDLVFNIEAEKRKVTLQWHEEFIADVYATFLLGPAYLFSFLEYYYSSKNMDEVYIPSHQDQRAYPSFRMRLYYILKVLSFEKQNFISAFINNNSAKLKKISKKFDELKDLTKGGEYLNHRYRNDIINDIIKVAWTTNQKLSNKTIEYAYKTLKPAHKKGLLLDINRDFNEKVLTQVDAKLDNNIPINEFIIQSPTGDIKTIPMPIFAILNYGWMRFIELTEKETVEKLKVKIYYLKQLIKRSAEASYFHQQYNEFRDRI